MLNKEKYLKIDPNINLIMERLEKEFEKNHPKQFESGEYLFVISIFTDDDFRIELSSSLYQKTKTEEFSSSYRYKKSEGDFEFCETKTMTDSKFVFHDKNYKNECATIKKAGRPKGPDLKKYIEKNCPKNSIFRLEEDYYQKFPHHRQHHKKFEKCIGEMISEKKLLQTGDKELTVIK